MSHRDITIVQADEHRRRIIAGLVDMGMDPDRAREYEAARWDLSGAEALDECRWRGLALTAEDLTDFLRQRFGRDTFPDGAPLTHEAVGWSRKYVDLALSWAMEQGRGEPATPPQLRPIATLADMLNALRSPELVERIAGMKSLSLSLGAGCKIAGETAEDFEHILAPQLSDLLGRAAATGDPELVDRIEALVTNVHPDHQGAAARAARN